MKKRSLQNSFVLKYFFINNYLIDWYIKNSYKRKVNIIY